MQPLASACLSRKELIEIKQYKLMTNTWIDPILMASVACLALALGTAGHAILHRDDARSAAGWFLVALLIPVVGPVFYWLLSAQCCRPKKSTNVRRPLYPPSPEMEMHDTNDQGELGRTHRSLILLGDRLNHTTLLGRNNLKVFDSGGDAYHAMLSAIDDAQCSVVPCVYQFDNDALGQQFVRSLAAATARGVEVKVLLDAFGSKLSRPSIVGLLRQAKISFKLFMPLYPWKLHLVNFRNHRKIMVVDRCIGFTGGMNIRQGHLAPPSSTLKPIRDVHFQVNGPVVGDLLHVFMEDWESAGGESRSINHELPTPIDVADDRSPQASGVLARGVSTGPDEMVDKLRLLLIGAITSARSSIDIITPYFLPDQGLLDALACAVMKGVTVRIIIPEKNLPIIGWALNGLLPQVLARGCLVFLSPPPYEHSKLTIIDKSWCLIGSANWDERSLRLNLEFNLECLSEPLGNILSGVFESKLVRSKPLATSDLERRGLHIRLRDNFFRLLSPYL